MTKEEMKALRARVINSLTRGADSEFNDVRGSNEEEEEHVIYAIDTATQLDIALHIELM